MAIVYDPKTMLKKIAPEAKVKKLLSGKLSVKKAALSFISNTDFLDPKSVSKVALNVAKSYKKRIRETAKEKTRSAANEIKTEILGDPRLLIQRVQNEVVTQITERIRENYKGKQYEWLPSSAEEPDPEHQLLYGTVRTIDEGEMPGDRYGCQCGMNILVDETKLDLE